MACKLCGADSMLKELPYDNALPRQLSLESLARGDALRFFSYKTQYKI